jgi:hypothetical protein
VGDHHVDRRQVEAWQHVQPSRTKGPCGLTGPERARASIGLDPDTSAIEPERDTPAPHTKEKSSSRPEPQRPSSRSLLIGGYSAGDPPDPIPNSEVKPRSADGTAGGTRWESTSPPISATHPAPAFLVKAGACRVNALLKNHTTSTPGRGARSAGDGADERGRESAGVRPARPPPGRRGPSRSPPPTGARDRIGSDPDPRHVHSPA